MNNDEHQHSSSPGGILSQQERTCEECQRPFIIPNVGLWAYKLVIKGKTHWFCRWNHMRAGERKLKESKTLKDAKGRKEELNPNKPSRNELEKDLSQGMLVKDIATKYDAGKSTVEKWKRDYGLQGIKSKTKENTAVDKPGLSMGPQVELHVGQPTGPHVEQLVETTTELPAGRSRSPMTSSVGVAMPNPILSEVIQDSPSLSEIEQFHTDTEAQELPKVEMDPVILYKPIISELIPGFDLGSVDDIDPEEEIHVPFVGYDPFEEPQFKSVAQSGEPLAITMEPVTPITPKTDTDWSDEFPILTKEYAQKLRDENLSSKLTDPAPRTSDETINDIFRDLNAVLFKLEGVYVNNAIADAQKLFRERLRDELADWVGEAR